MTESCNGGWAINHGYFLENGGMVTDDCAPYRPKENPQCSKYSQCRAVARIRKSYKLRSPSETDIQKEILRNGAVISDYDRPFYMA